MADDEWMLDLIDDDLEIPGWFLVPGDLAQDEQDHWVREVAADLVDVPCWDGPPLSAAMTHEMLVSALERRAESDSLAMLQVWPSMANATATCHIDILPSDAMWDWTDTDAVVHRVDEAHIGPGMQISTRRTVTLEDVDMDVSSVAFSFDNGEVTLIIGVAETLTTLVTLALPGLVALMRNIRLLGSDGAAFSSVEPTGITADNWDLEGTA